MSIGRILSSADVSAAGMQAERLRMEVVANNIANAHTTRGADGQPYRRQQVIFEEAALVDGQAGGVGNVEIVPDESPLPRVFDPAHPDADADGYVSMPNVAIPLEMVDLLVASRSYQANLKSLEMFRQSVEQTLSILRETR